MRTKFPDVFELSKPTLTSELYKPLTDRFFDSEIPSFINNPIANMYRSHNDLAVSLAELSKKHSILASSLTSQRDSLQLSGIKKNLTFPDSIVTEKIQAPDISSNDEKLQKIVKSTDEDKPE
jgi:hypothetical protein